MPVPAKLCQRNGLRHFHSVSCILSVFPFALPSCSSVTSHFTAPFRSSAFSSSPAVSFFSSPLFISPPPLCYHQSSFTLFFFLQHLSCYYIYILNHVYCRGVCACACGVCVRVGVCWCVNAWVYYKIKSSFVAQICFEHLKQTAICCG